MTNPKLAVTVNGSRKYKSPLDPGVLYDSVTWAISNGIPKYGLEKARLKMAVEYALDNPIGTLELGAFRPATGPARDQALIMASGAAQREWGKKADRGSEVHRLIERRLRGEAGAVRRGSRLRAALGQWDGDMEPYVATVDAFLKDFGPVFEHVELTIFNRAEGYAGSLDGIARMAKIPALGLVLVDWKTGGLWPEGALQLSAYAHADYGITDDGEVVTLPKVDRGALVQITPDGYLFQEVRIDTDAYGYFLSALAVARWGSAGRAFMLSTYDPATAAHDWDREALVGRIQALPLISGMWLTQAVQDAGIALTPRQWSEVEAERVHALLLEAEGIVPHTVPGSEPTPAYVPNADEAPF